MCAFQIAELDQLMPDFSGISVRDDQVSFARPDLQTWRKPVRRFSSGIYDNVGGHSGSVHQQDFSAPDRRDAFAEKEFCPPSFGLPTKKCGGTRWIDHRIGRHKQTT